MMKDGRGTNKKNDDKQQQGWVSKRDIHNTKGVRLDMKFVFGQQKVPRHLELKTLDMIRRTPRNSTDETLWALGLKNILYCI